MVMSGVRSHSGTEVCDQITGRERCVRSMVDVDPIRCQPRDFVSLNAA